MVLIPSENPTPSCVALFRIRMFSPSLSGSRPKHLLKRLPEHLLAGFSVRLALRSSPLFTTTRNRHNASHGNHTHSHTHSPNTRTHANATREPACAVLSADRIRASHFSLFRHIELITYRYCGRASGGQHSYCISREQSTNQCVRLCFIQCAVLLFVGLISKKSAASSSSSATIIDVDIRTHR